MSIRIAETDWKFRQYVDKSLERGDKQRLCALLCMSYPTLQLHLNGIQVNPAVQAQVIEFFERRKRSRSLASSFVAKRLDSISDEDIPVEQMPSLSEFLSSITDEEEPKVVQDQQ